MIDEGGGEAGEDDEQRQDGDGSGHHQGVGREAPGDVNGRVGHDERSAHRGEVHGADRQCQHDGTCRDGGFTVQPPEGCGRGGAEEHPEDDSDHGEAAVPL